MSNKGMGHIALLTYHNMMSHTHTEREGVSSWDFHVDKIKCPTVTKEQILHNHLVLCISFTLCSRKVQLERGRGGIQK